MHADTYRFRQNTCRCGHRLSVHKPSGRPTSHGTKGPCLAPACSCNEYRCDRALTAAMPPPARRSRRAA